MTRSSWPTNSSMRGFARTARRRQDPPHRDQRISLINLDGLPSQPVEELSALRYRVLLAPTFGGVLMTYSYTQISQYLSCPRRYRHRYLDGWQEKDTRPAMLFGRAFERAVAPFSP